jgi:predicted ATP-grasp superfamily ATP-dependent carboligase
VYSTDREFARHSKFLDGAFCSPPPEQEESFLDYLLSLAESRGRSVLIPTSDETLEAVARGKRRLNEHFDIASMDLSHVDIVLDKRKTSAFAAKHDIPAPRTFTPKSTGELKECAELIEYPCLVKPTSSYAHFKAFQRKMTKVYDADELVGAWQETAEASVDVVLQEFIPGPDTAGVNYNAYFRNGEPIAECTARKVRLSPPELGFPTAIVSKHVPEVIDLGRRLVGSLGLSGFSCTEFKLDARDERYKLMEVNARPNMSGALSVACGVDFPHIIYDELSGNEVAPIDGYKEQIYWIDTLPDLRQGLRLASFRALRQFSAPYRAPHVGAVLDSDDWRPFAASLLRGGKGALSRLARR